MTVRDLIKSTLRLAGIISSVQVPNAGEEQDTFLALKSLLGSWSNENLAINKYVREVFPLVPGQSRYSIGSEGDFDTVRPVIIEGVTTGYLRIVTTELTPFIPGDPFAIPDPIPDTPATYRTDYFVDQESPVNKLNIQEWAGINNKTIQSDSVCEAYFEGNSPLEYVNLYPVPQSQKGLVIYSKKTIVELLTIDDELELPPGYDRALKYNLAVEISPEFGRQISPDIAAIAMESKAAIKRLNSKEIYLKTDFPTGSCGSGPNRIFGGR